MVGLGGQKFSSYTMYRFEIKLNFKFILPLTQLDIVGLRLVSNTLTFLVGISIDIQLVISLVLANIREQIIRGKN